MEVETSVVLVVLLVLVVATVAAGVKTVPQGTEWMIERFGRYHASLKPGLNLILPYIDRVARRINVQESVLEIPSQLVITKDNASVTVDGVLFYQVFDAAASAYQVTNLVNAIINLATTNIRAAIGSLDLDETLSKRNEINARLLEALDAATHPWGTKITRVELKDVAPPQDVLAAMAKQLTADRQKRAAVLEAQGFKESRVLKAEGEKQSTILAAEGRLAAADLDAQARERLAEAEATATRVLSEAVAKGDIQALSYFLGQRYTDALTRIGEAPNTKLVMMPLEASNLIGALGGIGALLRQITDPAGKGGGPSAGGPPADAGPAGRGEGGDKPWTRA